MQLTLFANLPETGDPLWDQFSETVLEAAVDRLAQAIVKAVLIETQPQESNNE